jgi:hypothetical protein
MSEEISAILHAGSVKKCGAEMISYMAKLAAGIH